MTAAIFGIVGVAIGGLITFATQYVLLRRNERLRKRAAARIVAEEAAMTLSLLGRSTFGPGEAKHLLEVWSMYRHDLAQMRPKDWDVVAIPLTAVSRVAQPLDPPDPEATASELQLLVRQLRAARDVLDRVGRERWYSWLTTPLCVT